MAEFKGVSEKFHVSLLSEDGGTSQRVICQVLQLHGWKADRQLPIRAPAVTSALPMLS